MNRKYFWCDKNNSHSQKYIFKKTRNFVSTTNADVGIHLPIMDIFYVKSKTEVMGNLYGNFKGFPFCLEWRKSFHNGAFWSVKYTLTCKFRNSSKFFLKTVILHKLESPLTVMLDPVNIGREQTK